MTRIEEYRVRQAKHDASQQILRSVLDEAIQKLGLKPSAAFDEVLAYAVEGLIAQGTLRNQREALWRVADVLRLHRIT